MRHHRWRRQQLVVIPAGRPGPAPHVWWAQPWIATTTPRHHGPPPGREISNICHFIHPARFVRNLCSHLGSCDWVAIHKAQTAQQFQAPGMRTPDSELCRDIRLNRACGATDLRLQPHDQVALQFWRHTRPATLPAINRQSVPTIAGMGLVRTADRVVVKLGELCNPGAILPIIEQQKCIRPPLNPMILTLTPHTLFKRTAVFWAEEIGTDHGAKRTNRAKDVNS